MATSYTSDFPLILAGTDVLVNPSFEDWTSGDAVPYGWAKVAVSGQGTNYGTCTRSTSATHVFPCGDVALQLVQNTNAYKCAVYSTALSVTQFFSSGAWPSWVTYVAVAVPYYVVSAPSGTGIVNPLVAITSTFGDGGILASASITPTAGSRGIAYAEWAPNTNTFYIQLWNGRGNTGNGSIVYDSIMFGIVVDLDVYMSDWNPVAKTKKEKRETPFNVNTLLISNAYDLKCTFGKFGPTLKATILGMLNYTDRGHYYACILSRSESGPYRDEVFPYLYDDSQDSPKFYQGAPGVFSMSLNGRGCLP